MKTAGFEKKPSCHIFGCVKPYICRFSKRLFVSMCARVSANIFAKSRMFVNK